MHKNSTQQYGFNHLFILMFLIMISVIGLAGWKVYSKQDKSEVSKDQKSSETTKTEETKSKKISFSVIESGEKILPNGVADPTVAKIDGGYRMYVNQQSGGPSGYLTFISPDGVSWEKENGIVISGVATGRAVAMDGGIRFYHPGSQPINPTDPPAFMYSRFSSNGTDFGDAETAFEPRDGYYVEGPTVFQLEDKSWQMYFNENSVASGNQRDGEIFGAKSSDGINWTRDTETTIVFDEVEKEALGSKNAPWSQVLHPFVLKNPEGGYIMFYNAHSEVFTAVSEDGINWDKLGKLGIHGADVDGYFQEDGTIRLFYGDYAQETGGVVFTATVKID